MKNHKLLARSLYMTGKEKAMTDCARILEYMQTHGSITTYKAVMEIGCNSLSRRITDIIRAGTPITKTWHNGIDRYGNKTRYLEYSLEEAI